MLTYRITNEKMRIKYMKIEELQKNIDDTDYWDCKVLNFSIDYFGDEVNVVIEDDKQTAYVIKFLLCNKVEYETDAKNRWKEMEVKLMNRGQLAYYAHKIDLKESEEKGFMEVNLVLAPLFAKIICKGILVNKIKYNDKDYFWGAN